VAEAASPRTKHNYNDEQKKMFNAARQRFTRSGQSADPTAEAHAYVASQYKTATKAPRAAKVTKQVAVAKPASSRRAVKPVVEAPRSRRAAVAAPAAAPKARRGATQAIRPVRVAPASVAGVTAPSSATVVVSVFGSKKSFYPVSLKEWNQLGSTLFG
jgi:hypothetical protein